MRIRCPHCHHRIEFVDDSTFKDIECSSCGSSFNLVGETTEPYTQWENTITHFQFVERLGAGQFGAVWKARDTELDRIVAIKIPRKEQLNTAETEIFLREARAAAQLTHPNIVSVHEVGKQDDGSIYIVSDFVDGANLREWLAGRPLSMHEAAELCAKIAEALHHAHEAGVVHRDLKPANVMIDMQGEPHIMDFGLAKRDSGEITMTVEGALLGTPAYMSPEQARGEAHQADRRTDVYALGVMLFQMLTAELPFRGDKRMLLVQIQTDEPPSPRKLNSRIPRDLETICLKCLEKEPARRYATAQDFADELNRYLSGEPILARPISSTARTWRWCKRKPALAGLCAVAATLLLVLGIGGSAIAVQRSQYAAEQTRYAAEQRNNARQQAALRVQADEQAQRANTQAQRANTQAQRANTQAQRADKEAAAARAETNRAEHVAYRSDVRFVQVHWQNANLGPLRELLDRYRDRDDLQGFEWGYWDRLAHSELLTFKGHASFVTSVVFSPDGQRLASASGNTVRVWDASTGEELRTLKGHTSSITSVVFSPDGQRLASASYDKTVRVWDASTGEELRTLKGHTSSVNSVVFSPDGQRLASADRGNMVKVWDSSTGEGLLTLKGHVSHANSVVFSPDGQRLASASADRTVKLWDASTGEELLTLKGHTSAVNSVVFSPDGRRLASAGSDKTVRVWDASTGEELLTLKGHTGGVNSVVFSPDGQRLASASNDKTVKLWDARPWTPKLRADKQ